MGDYSTGEDDSDYVDDYEEEGKLLGVGRHFVFEFYTRICVFVSISCIFVTLWGRMG